MYYFNFIILLTEMQTYIQNICSFLSASDYPWSFAYAAVKIDSRWTDTCKLLPFHTVRAAKCADLPERFVTCRLTGKQIRCEHSGEKLTGGLSFDGSLLKIYMI